jgi:hypothetical protein
MRSEVNSRSNWGGQEHVEGHAEWFMAPSYYFATTTTGMTCTTLYQSYN